MKRKTTIQLIFLTALVLSLVLKVIWTLPYQIKYAWNNYQVVMIAGTAPTGSAPPTEAIKSVEIDKVKQILEDSGFQNIVSYDEQKVSLFQYPHLASVPLRSLPQLLEEKDPRYDEYLKQLPRYFEGSLEGTPAHVMYVEHGRRDVRPILRARKGLKELGVDYYLSGVNSIEKRLYKILIVLTVLVVYALYPKKNRKKGTIVVFLSGSLILLVGVEDYSLEMYSWWALHTLGWAVLLAWAGPAFTRYFNSEDESFLQALKKYLSVYFICSLLGATVMGVSGAPGAFSLVITHIFFTFIANGVLFYYFYLFHKYLSNRQAHTLFMPIHISDTRALSNRQVVIKLAVFFLLVGIVPVTVVPQLTSSYSKDAEFPRPKQMPGEISDSMPNEGVIVDKSTETEHSTEVSGNKGFSWNQVYHYVNKTGSSGGKKPDILLPDISDYVKHRAFQEGYFFGMSYSFPAPGKKITIPVYKQEGIKVLSRQKVVKMFTDDWYKDIITSAYKSGVPRLLLAQGRPVQVEIGTIEPFRISTYAILGHIGAMLIVVPVVFFIVSRKVISQSFLIEKQQLKKGQKVA